MPKFAHYDLALLNPSFDSPLVDVITELEHLRRLQLSGTTAPAVFMQIKQIFHFLESLASARIEGNHTTLADYIEQVVADEATGQDHLHEIMNIEKAMTFIEQTLKPGDPLTEHFIRELHALTVSELQREGDKTPGAYRTYPVQIAQASHLPPDALQVADYMQELVSFINQPDPDKYDLMKVAIAHHRFGWIHPFGNGNGRVVRLLTYAQLIQYGFNMTTVGRVINPTAVFCNDRDKYYEMLSVADSGTTEGLESWCLYVLSGVLDELKKLEKLTQHGYLVKQVFLPALGHARERALITPQEYSLLEIAVRQQIVKSADFAAIIPDPRARTYQISKLVNAKMLIPTEPNARQYTVGFANSYLLRGVIAALRAEGFISDALAGV